MDGLSLATHPQLWPSIGLSQVRETTEDKTRVGKHTRIDSETGYGASFERSKNPSAEQEETGPDNLDCIVEQSETAKPASDQQTTPLADPGVSGTVPGPAGDATGSAWTVIFYSHPLRRYQFSVDHGWKFARESPSTVGAVASLVLESLEARRRFIE